MLVTALPIAMIALSIGSAIVYLYCGDIKHSIYWMASSILIASITF